jgi:hypothetical protein
VKGNSRNVIQGYSCICQEVLRKPTNLIEMSAPAESRTENKCQKLFQFCEFKFSPVNSYKRASLSFRFA